METEMIELKKYEVTQYTIAFEDGTDEAWNRYRRNVKRAVDKFERKTGLKVDIDALMA